MPNSSDNATPVPPASDAPTARAPKTADDILICPPGECEACDDERSSIPAPLKASGLTELEELEANMLDFEEPHLPPASDAPAPPRETTCPACEPGRTVIRVTLDRKCVECGRPVSDEPQRNSDQSLTIERARAKCLEVERTWGASEVATMASLACFGALVLAEKAPWVRHHVDAIHALVDSLAPASPAQEARSPHRCADPTRCTICSPTATASFRSPAQEATPLRCANPNCDHPESEHQSACWACRRVGNTCLYFNRRAAPTPEATAPRCTNPDCGHDESQHQSACWACRREGKTCLFFNPPAVPAREASSAPTEATPPRCIGCGKDKDAHVSRLGRWYCHEFTDEVPGALATAEYQPPATGRYVTHREDCPKAVYGLRTPYICTCAAPTPEATGAPEPLFPEWPTGVAPSTTTIDYSQTTPIPDAAAARLLTEQPHLQTTGWEAMMMRHIAALTLRCETLECRPLVLLTSREVYAKALVDAQVCDAAEAERRAVRAFPAGADFVRVRGELRRAEEFTGGTTS